MADVHDSTIALAKELIACQSVTPDDGGSLAVVADRLRTAGFACARIDRGGVRNLWARRGHTRPLVCLAGHVDVVPPGPLSEWASDPFAAVERNGSLYGRGAADMKTSVAAMVTALERLAAGGAADSGSLALLLTSDEEGDALHGTVAVVDALRARGERIDACIVGEPTSNERLGDTIKNGRRGSLNGTLRVKGVQGHVAYPERGRNPVHDALPALAALTAATWDSGNEYFPPTSLQISNVHAGTGANNVIPGELTVLFNIRFSPASTVDDLKARVHAILDASAADYAIEWKLTGAPFMTKRGSLTDALSDAVRETTGLTPVFSTTGGTSDGRILAEIADQVVEFGPVNQSIHKIDEHVRVADIAPLSFVYERTVARLLALQFG